MDMTKYSSRVDVVVEKKKRTGGPAIALMLFFQSSGRIQSKRTVGLIILSLKN